MIEIEQNKDYNLSIVDDSVIISNKIDEIIEEKPKKVRKKKE